MFCWVVLLGFPYGGVAQLGERLLCKQEVVGSIPSASRAWVCRHGMGFESGGMGWDHHCRVGFWRMLLVLCSLWIVNQVLVRFWTRGTARVVSAFVVRFA